MSGSPRAKRQLLLPVKGRTGRNTRLRGKEALCEAQYDDGKDPPDTCGVRHERNAQEPDYIYSGAGFQPHRQSQMEPINTERAENHGPQMSAENSPQEGHRVSGDLGKYPSQHDIPSILYRLGPEY